MQFNSFTVNVARFTKLHIHSDGSKGLRMPRRILELIVCTVTIATSLASLAALQKPRPNPELLATGCGKLQNNYSM